MNIKNSYLYLRKDSSVIEIITPHKGVMRFNYTSESKLMHILRKKFPFLPVTRDGEFGFDRYRSEGIEAKLKKNIDLSEYDKYEDNSEKQLSILFHLKKMNIEKGHVKIEKNELKLKTYIVYDFSILRNQCKHRQRIFPTLDYHKIVDVRTEYFLSKWREQTICTAFPILL